MDERNYYPEDMAQNWITDKIFCDINVRKPMACFHHIVFFSKRLIFIVILTAYNSLGFTQLMLYTCLNLLTLVWTLLVRPYKYAPINRVAIWIEMCQLASSLTLWPLQFAWTPDTYKVMFSNWHYSIIMVMPLVTCCIHIGSHIMRKVRGEKLRPWILPV